MTTRCGRSPAASQASAQRTPGPRRWSGPPPRRRWAAAGARAAARRRTSPHRLGPQHAGVREQRVDGWRPTTRAARRRPLLTTTIGFVVVIRRAIRPNRRGFPNDSRWSNSTDVSGPAPSTRGSRCRRVRLVAHRHERREPDAARYRRVDRRDRRTRCSGRRSRRVRRRRPGRDGRVERDLGTGIRHAEAVRAQHAHPGGPADGEQIVDLGEARRQHDEGAQPLAAQARARR